MITIDVIRQLFQECQPTVHATLREEIESVYRSRKPIAMYSFLCGHRDQRFHQELSDHAARLGLHVIEHSNREGAVTLYVVRDDEQRWRAMTLSLLERSTGKYPRSECADYLMSSLLGYCDAEVDAWMRHLSNVNAAPNGMTCYALVDRRELPSLTALAMRCFDPGSATALTLFYNSNVGVSGSEHIGDKSLARVPDGYLLARLAISTRCFFDLFPPFPPESATVRIAVCSRDAVPHLNGALRSNIQLFTADGWK